MREAMVRERASKDDNMQTIFGQVLSVCPSPGTSQQNLAGTRKPSLQARVGGNMAHN